MKAVAQRVSQASVSVSGETLSQIKQGFLILLGAGPKDTEADVDYLVKKISNLRVFADQNDKMNLSLKDINGEVLVVSQFTLYASTKKGNRPSFTKTAPPELAQKLYQLFIKKIKSKHIKTQTGKFGAMMQVSLINDGPVTILFDSQDK